MSDPEDDRGGIYTWNTAWCSGCLQYLPRDAFHKRSKAKSGLQAWCKGCAKKRRAEWRVANPGKNRNSNRRSNLRRLGRSLELYNTLLEAQQGMCAICGQPETQLSTTGDRIRSLSIDHDHVTGNVRGLLCGNCNRGLGYFKDNPILLQAAITYLEATCEPSST